jgi:hypothetical protein
MYPVTASPQQNSSDGPQQSSQDQQATGFFSGSWGTRDVAMFSTQGISALGALANTVLGAWNTSATTTPPANNTQPSSLTTGNSYVLIGFGVLFGVATLIQVASHYHWRKDTQDAKNINFSSLANELEKDIQDFQVVVEKTEAMRQKIGALTRAPTIPAQIPPGAETKRFPDHKTIPKVDDLSDASGKITV